MKDRYFRHRLALLLGGAYVVEALLLVLVVLETLELLPGTW